MYNLKGTGTESERYFLAGFNIGHEVLWRLTDNCCIDCGLLLFCVHVCVWLIKSLQAYQFIYQLYQLVVQLHPLTNHSIQHTLHGSH